VLEVDVKIEYDKENNCEIWSLIDIKNDKIIGKEKKHFFDMSHYVAWDCSRIEAIKRYYPKNFFVGKKVLEVGCGWAAIGNAMHQLGADVTVSDARAEHIEEVRKRYPHLKTHVYDLEYSKKDDWNFPEEKYDIIIHFGVLYHLSNPVENLKFISDRCDYLIIETEVLDSKDSNLVNLVKEEPLKWKDGAWGNAFSGIGSKPSYGLVESTLEKNGMIVTKAPNPELLNAADHKYDWIKKDTGQLNGVCQRAMWFCEKAK